MNIHIPLAITPFQIFILGLVIAPFGYLIIQCYRRTKNKRRMWFELLSPWVMGVAVIFFILFISGDVGGISVFAVIFMSFIFTAPLSVPYMLFMEKRFCKFQADLSNNYSTVLYSSILGMVLGFVYGCLFSGYKFLWGGGVDLKIFAVCAFFGVVGAVFGAIVGYISHRLSI